MSTSPSKHEERITWLLQWIDQTIKFRNSWGHSAEAAAIMIEKKQRKKLKRKKSESLSDRFLLGVSHIHLLLPRFKTTFKIGKRWGMGQTTNEFMEYYCAHWNLPWYWHTLQFSGWTAPSERSVGELIDGRVMTVVMKNPLGQREVNEPCSNLPFGNSF